MTDNVIWRLETAPKAIDRYHPYRYIKYALVAQAPTMFEDMAGKI